MTQGISTVIPTKGRVALVEAAVRSLARSAKSLPAGVGWEVLLVDDSAGADARRLRALADGVHTRYLRGPARVGAKRNVGAHSSAFDHLIFLDSDCSVAEGFLSGHLAAASWTVGPSGRLLGAIAGPVHMADDAHSWRTRLADYSPLFNAPFEWPQHYAELYWACTANLAVRREVFEAVGGFDEQTYTVVGGEDIDFCLRLQDAGYAVCSQPTAVAIHTRTLMPTFGDMAAKMLLYGRTSVYNTLRHPHHGEFHPNPTVLTLLAAAAPWSRLARRSLLPASAGWLLVQATSLMYRTRRMSPLALPAVALEWIFDTGLAVEALRRRRPAQILRRFKYFDDLLYRPHDGSTGHD